MNKLPIIFQGLRTAQREYPRVLITKSHIQSSPGAQCYVHTSYLILVKHRHPSKLQKMLTRHKT